MIPPTGRSQNRISVKCFTTRRITPKNSFDWFFKNTDAMSVSSHRLMRYPKNSRFIGIGDGFAKQNRCCKAAKSTKPAEKWNFYASSYQFIYDNQNPTYEDHANVLSWLNHKLPKNWMKERMMRHESHAEISHPTQRSLAGFSGETVSSLYQSYLTQVSP